MYKESQHVIPGMEGHHVIGKAADVHRNPVFPIHHLEDRILKPLEIQVNIGAESFKSLCLVPIKLKFSKAHGADHGTRVIDRAHAFQKISVIPFLRFLKIHAIALAQPSDLGFRKTRIFCKRTLEYHGKFVKHIQGTVGPVFFDGKDSCHIAQRNISLILEHIPQEIQI